MCKIILGTVQFGLDYGINNIYGKPSEDKVFEILDTAILNNIEFLDTADAYGNAIDIIGKYHKIRKNKFKILSKFKNVKKNSLYDIVKTSLNKLLIDSFEVYSYHSFDEYMNNRFLLEELIYLKKMKMIKCIGLSIYDNNEFEYAINKNEIDIIQIPFNILDNNNIRGELLKKAKQKGITIHTRSVFLQGLFFMDESKIPPKLNPLKTYIEKIKHYCKENNLSIFEISFSYPFYNKYIDSILIGVDSNEQFIQNIKCLSNNYKAFEFIDENILVKEANLLNPVNW